MVYYKCVEITYFDESNNFYTIDAWKTDDDNEEGRVVGVVHPSGDYYIFDLDARCCDHVAEVVKDKVAEIKSKAIDINPPSECESKTMVLQRDKFPKVYATKREELIEEGLSEEQADEVLSCIAFEMEFYYSKHNGLFAVEAEAVASGKIADPYTQIPCKDWLV